MLLRSPKSPDFGSVINQPAWCHKLEGDGFTSFGGFQQRQDGGSIVAAIGQAGGWRLAEQDGIRKILHFRQVGVRAFHNNRGGFAVPGQVKVLPARQC